MTPSSLPQRAAIAVARAGRVRWIRAIALSPVIARPGYWFATGAGAAWGFLLSGGRIHRRGGVLVAAGMPLWSFGRGGTTIGAIYLTRDNHADPVLAHEAIHRAQWRHYGLTFPVLYLAAGQEATTNRFEIAAGLADGGYT